MNTVSATHARELDVWYAVRKLDTAFRALLSSMPREPGRDDLWSTYGAERAALIEPIDRLSEALHRALRSNDERSSKRWDERCLLALLVLYDELELSALGNLANQRASVPFQTEHCGIHDGGQQFYDLVDDALSLATTPALALQLLLFCLQAGFCGRIPTKSDPEREEYVRRLGLRVDEAAEHRHTAERPPPAHRRITGVDFPFSYYAVAAVFVCCVWLALGMLARNHECMEFHCGWQRQNFEGSPSRQAMAQRPTHESLARSHRLNLAARGSTSAARGSTSAARGMA